MLWVYEIINIFTLTARGSTLDVRIYRRQILTTKVDPRAARVKVETSVSTLISHMATGYSLLHHADAYVIMRPFVA